MPTTTGPECMFRLRKLCFIHTSYLVFPEWSVLADPLEASCLIFSQLRKASSSLGTQTIPRCEPSIVFEQGNIPSTVGSGLLCLICDWVTQDISDLKWRLPPAGLPSSGALAGGIPYVFPFDYCGTCRQCPKNATVRLLDNVKTGVSDACENPW